MKKINTKALIALLSGASLATFLIACSPSKSTEEPKKESIENVQEEVIEETKEEPKEEIIDNKSFNERYFEQLKEDLNEVKNIAEDKWNSEEVVEKRENAKEKFREVVDFVFNGKEINGVTFSELKTEEKEKIIKHLLELDEYIDEYIPDYKERLKNWFSEKGTKFKDWLVDKSADAKELWEDYKSEVEEEYENRQMSKHV